MDFKDYILNEKNVGEHNDKDIFASVDSAWKSLASHKVKAVKNGELGDFLEDVASGLVKDVDDAYNLSKDKAFVGKVLQHMKDKSYLNKGV
jgi:hypothetical protein